MTNLLTATNLAPSVLVTQYIPTTGAAQYTVPAGTSTQVVDALITNTDASVAQTVTLSRVKSGGSAGGSTTILPAIDLPAKATLDLGKFVMGDGDFIWAQAGNASKVTINMTGHEFSNATGAVLSGIQDDAIGTLGRTASSGSVTSTCKIGAASNRRLFGALMVTCHASSVTWSSFGTLTVGIGAALMTHKVGVDFNQSSNLNGSLHFFEYVNPTSSSTQTLTANVAQSGLIVDLTLFSFSLSGVASSTVTATTGPSSAAALSLPLTSAVGHRALFAACFQDAPMDFNQRVRAFGGNSAIGAAVPHWMIVADALGAPTVTAQTSNSQFGCGIALDCVPA